VTPLKILAHDVSGWASRAPKTRDTKELVRKGRLSCVRGENVAKAFEVKSTSLRNMFRNYEMS
jgi:hypothetical protein